MYIPREATAVKGFYQLKYIKSHGFKYLSGLKVVAIRFREKLVPKRFLF